jgi:hypothetical protein
MQNRDFTVHAYGRRLAESRIREICTYGSMRGVGSPHFYSTARWYAAYGGKSKEMQDVI